ncbi:MAG: 23S rRNA pseudouridine(1911/1915/1917) synthase RluD [Betaproteobacteria bacterium]
MPQSQPAPDPSRHVFTVPEGAAVRRLDQALAALLPQHSRTRLKGWIEAGQVSIDGTTVVEPRFRIHGGEAILVTEGVDANPLPDHPEDIAIAIVFEDDAIMVVDKAAGLVVHPGSGNRAGTLLNALLHHAPALATLPRAGIVHRLDKDTSGLMVVAKTAIAQTDLVRQLAARTVKREYLAVVHGDLKSAMTIDAPIGRHPVQRTSMAVVTAGKPARTHVDVVERFGMATQLRCRLETGRTHQIRVHLAAIGHPLVGDPTYRAVRGRTPALPPAALDFGRQALHAQRLGLVHPITREAMEWSSMPPADLIALVDHLRTAAQVNRNTAA